MRQVVAVAFGLVVLVAAGLGVVQLLERTADDAVAPLDGATTAATTWADAATDGDLPARVELTTERTDRAALSRVAGSLEAAVGGPVATELAGLVLNDDGSATATLARTATLGDAGSWSWTSELVLQRARGSWSVDWTPAAEHPRLRTGWSIAVVRTPPVRAPVLDRRGRVLSGTNDLVVIGVQPSRLPDEGRLVSTVAGALPEALSALQALLARDDLEPDWFYPLVTVDAARADEAFPGLLGIPGILRRPAGDGPGSAPFAPELLGTVVATEDGGLRGAGGLQLLLDERLAGSEVVRVEVLDADGRTRLEAARLQADPSPPVVTTLDRDVQQALQDALLTETGAVGVALVDVAGGGLVATTSRPANGYARALEGAQPPGTVAGTVPLAAALLDGRRLGEFLSCPAEGVAGGVTITAGGPSGGTRPLQDALEPGCAVGLGQLAAELGPTAMARAQTALGLDTAPDLRVLSVGWRGVPPDATPAAVASGAVGQGRVTSSTVAAAALAATVARGGPVATHLLADEAPSPGPALPRGVAVDLRAAWTAAGAAGPVVLDDARVAGVVGRTGLVRADPAPATGWWVGWLVDGGPQVALAVTVEGDDGSRAAALAERILRELTA